MPSRLLLLVTLLVATPALAGCPHPLRVGWDNWPPYHFKNSDGQMQGFAIEVLTQVSQSLGCKLEFRERPWKRQLQELQSGSRGFLAPSPHNTLRAGPHRAFHLEW